MFYVNILKDFWYYLSNFEILTALKFVVAYPAFFAIVAAVIVFFCFYIYFKMKNPAAGTTYGSARFAKKAEVEKILFNDESTGIICGKFDGKNCVLSNKHLFLCAPTGAGKGVGTIIPTLLKYGGSVLVNDVKGENYYVTKRAREEMGQKVYMMAPFGHTYKHLGGKSCCYNPLELIDAKDNGAATQVQRLSATLISGTAYSEKDFWTLTPRAIVATVVMHVCEKYNGDEKNLGKVKDILALKTEDFIKVVEIEMVTSEIDYIVDGANLILSAWADGEGAKLFSSLQSVIKTETDFLKNDLTKAFFSKSDVPLDSLMFEEMSVYYIVDPAEIKAAEKIGAIIFNDALGFITKTSKRNEGRLSNNIETLFLIDEFPQLSYMPAFEKAMGVVRSFGAVMYVIIQDIAQLKGIYDKSWSTFISNSASMYIGAQDVDTAKYICEMLGNKTVLSKSIGSDNKTSYSEVAKPLRSVDELLSDGNDNTILFPGKKTRPVLLTAIEYYKDKDFMHDADKNPCQRAKKAA